MAEVNSNYWRDIATAGFLVPTTQNASSILSTFGYHIFQEVESNFKDTYVQDGQELLITEFRKKRVLNSAPYPNNMQKFLQPFLEEMQEIEYVLSELITLRWLSSSSGTQLDKIGEVLGLSRKGLTDNEYRAMLQYQVFSYKASGESSMVSDFLKLFTNATRVRIIEAYPAGVYLFTDGNNIIGNVDIKPFAERLLAAGVKLRGIFYIDPDSITFSFEWDGVIPDDGSKGWDELNYLEAGKHVGGVFYELF